MVTYDMEGYCLSDAQQHPASSTSEPEPQQQNQEVTHLPLADSQLIDGGLKPITAWIRTDPCKEKRKSRNDRYRGKQAKNGIKQLTIRVPKALADQVKALAAEALHTQVLSLPETKDWQERAERAESLLEELETKQVKIEDSAQRLQEENKRLLSALRECETKNNNLAVVLSTSKSTASRALLCFRLGYICLVAGWLYGKVGTLLITTV